MRVDLHTHSTASDGVLAPRDLLARAVEAGAEIFSITDHDTLAAYEDIGREACHGGTRVIAGIELSAEWRGRVVHVLGYGFDWPARALAGGIALQRERRELRARAIGERLARKGIDGAYDAARALAGDGSIGRPHFARHLVASGFARTMDEAFSRWLSDRATAGLGQPWASLADAVGWITADGGAAVLAHPAKYQMTHTRLRELLADFVVAGGAGLEVQCGRQLASTTAELARHCTRFGLAGSVGTDFHAPARWAPAPGMADELPTGVTPLWARW